MEVDSTCRGWQGLVESKASCKYELSILNAFASCHAVYISSTIFRRYTYIDESQITKFTPYISYKLAKRSYIHTAVCM